MSNVCLFDDLMRYLGQTVTIFTESGGLSGSGFTGVLAFASPECVRLITAIGAPPACPVGSACTGWPYSNYDSNYGSYGGGYSGGWPSNFLGSVVDIPVCKIVSFTHIAI